MMVMDKHVCFFYIQYPPKQGTILDLVIHVTRRRRGGGGGGRRGGEGRGGRLDNL